MNRRQEIEQRLEQIADEICAHKRGDAMLLTIGGVVESDDSFDRRRSETHEEAIERLNAKRESLLEELAIAD